MEIVAHGSIVVLYGVAILLEDGPIEIGSVCDPARTAVLGNPLVGQKHVGIDV